MLAACQWTKAGGVAGLAELIEDGAVQVRARLADVHGLRGLLVDVDDVRRAVRLRSGGELSPKEAATELNMHEASVWAYMRDGLIAYAPLGAQAAVISREAIAQFQTTYVTTSELATAMGSHPRYVAVALRDCAVQPVESPHGENKMRVAVYRRADIPRHFGETYRRRYGRR